MYVVFEQVHLILNMCLRCALRRRSFLVACTQFLEELFGSITADLKREAPNSRLVPTNADVAWRSSGFAQNRLRVPPGQPMADFDGIARSDPVWAVQFKIEIER